MSERLDSPEVQARLRALDRRLSAIEAADLDELLRHDWGRRLYYRLTHEMGLLVASSFEPGIKDGLCAALHQARNEGIREFAIRLMAEAQAVAPDLWARMLTERIAAKAADAAKREQAKVDEVDS